MQSRRSNQNVLSSGYIILTAFDVTARELFKMAKIRLSSQQAANKNLKPSILYVKENAGSNSCVC